MKKSTTNTTENRSDNNVKEKVWNPLEGRGGFFEVCYETGEVRFKDTKEVVKNLRWNNETRSIKEYRTREYTPAEEEVKEAGRVYVGSKGDYLEWDYRYDAAVFRTAEEDEEEEEDEVIFMYREPFPRRDYQYVKLEGKDGRKHKELIHLLVARTFLKEPEDKESVLVHLDGNIQNNRVDNLKWVSLGESKYYIPRKVGMYNLDLELIEEFPNVEIAAEETGIDRDEIYNAVKENGYE